MEEDIKLLEELIEHNYLEDIFYLRENNHHTKFNKAIENLINKNKELEKSNKYWGNKIAEYHKIIELMADYIDLYGECVDNSKEDCKEAHCQKCIIDYFRKKAKGE